MMRRIPYEFEDSFYFWVNDDNKIDEGTFDFFLRANFTFQNSKNLVDERVQIIDKLFDNTRFIFIFMR